MTSSLSSKVVIITGAASGMGKSMTAAFLKAGATVIAFDVNARLLEEVKTELSSLGDFYPVVADLTELDRIEPLFKETIGKYGHLDILVNNAGIYDRIVPVGELDLGLWNRVMTVNLTVPMVLTKLAVQEFLRHDHPGPKGGVILNMGSICGLRGGLGGAAYTASKHGLLGLTRSTTASYWKKNIRCNIIMPGSVSTNIISGMELNPAGVAMSHSIKGLLDPELVEKDEIGKLAVYLCSDDAKCLNGAIISVDNGWQAL